MPKQLNISMSVTADTSQARKQLQDLQKTLGDLVSNSVKNNIGKTMDDDLRKAVTSAKQLKDMLAEASNTKTGNLDLSKFSQEIQKSGRSIEQYAQDLSNLGTDGTKAFMQLAQSVAAAEVPMKRTFGFLDQFKVTLANAARWQISSSVLHGLMSAMQGAYGYAQDLDKSLTNIRIVTGQSTEEMARFADQANKSAQALSTSTLAYTDAALIYYQQGLEGQDVADRVETTLKLSNVTGESAEEVSSYMTAIWNNFRKGGESLESFADKITALGAATASSSREIAGGLQQFAAVADTVGLSYDYAASALATVVAQTRQSESTVGNAFRTIFSRLEGLKLGETLEDGTDLNKYSGALQTIGVNIKDQNGELKEMDTILEEIGAKWETLSRDQQMALAQTVGGVRQYANLIALFDNWDKFQQNLAVSQGAEGTLDEQAKRYEESWQAAQKRVQAAWQAIYQDLIDSDFFIDLLNGVEKFLQAIDTLIDALGGLKGILPGIGILLTTIFAKDIANGIETITYNFKVFTGSAQKEADDLAHTFANLGKAMAENLSSPTVSAEATVAKQQIETASKLRDISEEITAKQKSQLQSLNDITKAYGDAWINAEKLRQTAEETYEASSREAANFVANTLGGDFNERQNTRAKVYQEFNYEIAKDKINQFQKLNGYANGIEGDLNGFLSNKNLAQADWNEYSEQLAKVTKNSRDVIKAHGDVNKILINTKILLKDENATNEQKRQALIKLSAAMKNLGQDSKVLSDYLSDYAAQKAHDLGEELGLTEEQIQKLEGHFTQLAADAIKLKQAEDEAANGARNFNNQAKETENIMNGLTVSMASYAEQITTTARGLSQLLMAYNSFKTAWEAFTNEDDSPIERFKNGLPSLLMGIPMLTSSIKTLAGEGSLLRTGFDHLVTTFEAGEIATASTAGGISAVVGELGSLAAALLPIIGYVLLAVAAFTALKHIFDVLYEKSPEGQLEKANKELEDASEKAKEATAAYNELKNTLEEYKQVQEEINSMEPGTDKIDKVLEENNKILDFLNEKNLWDLINENGGLQYDNNGLIDITETQEKVISNELRHQRILEQQAETQAKINQLKAQGAVDYQQNYDGQKIEIQRGVKGTEQKAADGSTYYLRTENADVTQDIAKILKDAGLTIGDDRDKIEEAIRKSGDDTIVQQLETIMASLDQIRANGELSEQFNQLQLDSSGMYAAIDAYNMQYAQSAMGSYISEETSFGPAQQALLEAFAQLGPDVQQRIQEGIESGTLTFAEAFDKEGIDVAEKIHDAMVDSAQSAVDKASSVLGTNGSLTFSDDEEMAQKQIEFVMSLSDEDLASVGGWAGLQESLNKIGHEHNIDVNVNADDFTQLKSSIKDEDLLEEVQQLADYLQDYSDEVDDLSDHLADCRAETEKIAYAIMRFDDAIQDVTENYDDWSEALAAGGQRAAMAFKDLAKAYGNVMDIDGSALSTEFLSSTEHLNDMKLAIEGNEEAYNRLLDAAARDDLANNFGQSAAQIDNLLGAVSSAMDAVEQELGRPIQAGENIRSDALEASLNNILALVGNNVDAANRLLAELGYDAELEEVTEKKPANTETVSLDVTPDKEVPVKMPTYEGLQGLFGPKTQTEFVSGGFTVTPRKDNTPSESVETVTALKIKPGTVHKAVGGNVKFKQATHGGGGVSPSKGSGSGGGGGGGSKKKTVKEHTKPVKNEDRYHDIKERIDDLNKSLTRLGKTENRIYGKAKLKYMDMEIEKLEKQIDLTDEYIAEIKKYAAQDQANLRGIGMGAEFDANGMLTNYEQVLANITDSYNAAIGAYNSAIDAFNGSAQEDADNEALDGAKKQLDAAKEVYDENQKILKQYEDTYNLLQEQVDKRIDQVWELFDMRLKKITFEVEFEISWNERDLKYLDWLLENIGDTADKGVDKIANLAKQMEEYADTIDWAKKGIAGIFGLHGINFDFDNADPVALTNQLTDAMHRLNFESQLTEDEANALLDYCDTLMEAIDGIRDKWKAAHEAVNDTWDKWNERLERETGRLENYAKEMDSIKNIIDLTGRKMLGLSTQDIDKMNQSQIENNWAQVESWKAIMEARKASMEEAKYYMENAQTEEVREEWRKSYEQFEDDYNNAHQNYYSAWEETLEKVQDAFEETMDNLGKDYNDAMGDLTLLQEQFARKQEIDHLYLDDYEKYHELNKSSDELRKSLENTNSTMMKSKMNDLLDEMNASMRDGVQISEAQAEIYARRVALLQAEAELLDAQNAKSAVRMTRDNEGNFSYTYTADQDQIDDAEGNFQDKFYEVLDYERQYMEDIQGQMLDMTEQFWSDYYDLCERYKDDSAALEEAIEALVDDYNAKMAFMVSEQDMDMQEMARLRDEDWKDFENLTGKKLANQNDFITKFKETIVGKLRPQYQNANDYATQWQKTVEKTTQEGNKAVDRYQSNTQKTFEKAGENITTYGNKAVEKMDEIAGQSQTTKDKVTEMSGQMQIDMGQVMSVAWSLDSTWATVMNNMRSQIAQTVSALYQLLQKLQEVQAQAQATIIAAREAAMAQQYAGLGNSLGGGNSGNSGGGNSGNPGGSNPGGTTTPGSSSYHTLYGGAGTADHAITDGNGGYVTGGTRGSGNTGYGVITTGNNTSMPTDVYAMLKRQGLVKASGGYTGAWGPEGVVNILHEKEFVLNKDDTANIFKVVDLVRQLDDKFGLSRGLGNFANSIMNSGAFALAGANAMDQNVHIEANFPNVQSHTEIETALNNLVNSAAQYVNRK